MRFLIFIIGVLSITLNSCIKNNPDPSWIEIEPWILKENLDIEEGELSHNFSDVYITIDDNIIGIFELPIKLPILEEGNHKITLYPVIKKNGISATKTIYPFCEPHIIYVNLIKNQVTKITPETSYYDETDFWIEDFENSNFKIDDDNPYSMGTITKNNLINILKYGNYYGHIKVTESDSIWLGKTTPTMSLPKAGAEVYLEIDYMNNNSLLTGVYASSSVDFRDHPNIQLNPQEESNMVWKKMYIELKEIVSSSVTATDFEHYFKAILDANNTEGNIYIDNIKIVHF